jgi:hypothetical protein
VSLAAFVAKVRSPAIAWHGNASAWRVSHRPYEIARQAGLAPPPGALVAIDRQLAAKVFAYVRSESLTHGRKRYRASFLEECRDLLAELEDGAQFYSNSEYRGCFDPSQEPSAWGFTPLTDHDIDTGVIGLSSDGQSGFVYWRAENS